MGKSTRSNGFISPDGVMMNPASILARGKTTETRTDIAAVLVINTVITRTRLLVPTNQFYGQFAQLFIDARHPTHSPGHSYFILTKCPGQLSESEHFVTILDPGNSSLQLCSSLLHSWVELKAPKSFRNL
jgi:hypothetical protein